MRAARALLTPHGRRKARASLVEGRRLVEEALRQGAVLERCFYRDEAVDATLLRALKQAGCQLHPVAHRVLRTLSETATPQGVVAVVRRRPWSLESLLEAPEPFVLVLDGIQEPGNVGTLLRAGWASAVSGAVFFPGTADPYQTKALRASAGALFRLPHLWAPEPEALLQTLQGAGLSLWVAEAAQGPSPDQADLTGPGALILGSEARGASPVSRRMARPLTIPMPGGAESLNVAMAGAILLYERVRQQGRRRGATSGS
ncbi:TrmH family RNA methyltransferase [Limnochorda pilosa]|uniref:RNA methyltransferase n=1 Tax=Limnochorda pilosa TaxID=1555112 RepID=A0A0K2SMV3_LIMPI|nr:RNA methyltransferase [Limnochorda pilosa]BAS28337.1 RNA methyltransferase [Limnochorda pilosa]